MKPQTVRRIRWALVGALGGGLAFGLVDLLLQISTGGPNGADIDLYRLIGVASAGAIVTAIMLAAGGRVRR